MIDRRRDKPFEDALLDHLWKYHAIRLRDVAQTLGMPDPSDRAPKQFGAQVVARAIDAGPATISMLDLEKRGIVLRTVRTPREGAPYESTSLPAFDHTELAKETWERSTLRRQLGYVLFVTLYGRDKSTPLPACEFGDGFFWVPTEPDWDRIKKDWEQYRDRIRAGSADDLPKESETQAIHVRPHGRDSLDLDDAPGAHRVPRKSFWLNKALVEELIERELRTGT